MTPRKSYLADGTPESRQQFRHASRRWTGRIGLLLLFGSLAIALASVRWQPLTFRTHAAAHLAASSGVEFGPTVPNKQPAPGKTPLGMVWIPGGEFSMGAQDPPTGDMVGMQATTDSRPIHR